MNHFFLPIHYRYRSQKAIRALRVFQEKRKVSFCQVKRNKVKVRPLIHVCLRFPDSLGMTECYFALKNS